MTRPLRFIQIGVGGFGHWWRHAFLPNLREKGLAEAAAAVDINADLLPEAGASLGLPPERLYTSAKQAFDETEADFAVIVVPPAFHEEMVELAIGHGCHILSEKPIADSMAACSRIYHRVKASGLKMAVTMSHRFDADKQSLQREIESGRYGRLNYLVHRFTCNCRKFGSWGRFRHEIPDPLLVEGTVHHFDIHRAIAGSNAKTVYASTWNPPWGEYAGDSTGLVIIEMENGVRCLYEGAKANATTLNGWGGDYLRAECEDATLELDNRWLRVLRSGAAPRPLVTDLALREQPLWMNAWLAEMFCRWVNGETAGHPTCLEDNIQCAALLFAAVESAHTGAVVDVQEYLRRHIASAG